MGISIVKASEIRQCVRLWQDGMCDIYDTESKGTFDWQKSSHQNRGNYVIKIVGIMTLTA